MSRLTNHERVSNEGCQISITHMSRWIIAGWEWENIVEGVQTEENQLLTTLARSNFHVNVGMCSVRETNNSLFFSKCRRLVNKARNVMVDCFIFIEILC